MMPRLEGKVALVTGAAKRIGRSLALALASQGADVAITYRSSEAEAQATVDDLSKYGVRAIAVACDIREEASVTAAVAAVLGEFNRIDVLVSKSGMRCLRRIRVGRFWSRKPLTGR
jgi:NAD(P)-dependent dehydrogenase (short-subunit alcohol dehydrogenase family)